MANLKVNMSLTKNEMPEQDPIVRAGNFEEVALGYNAETAMKEAARCLGCGATTVDTNRCVGCGLCTTKCEFDAIHLFRERPECSTMIASEKKIPPILGNFVKKAGRITVKKVKEKVSRR